MYYAGAHLDASLGGKLGGMVHSSSYQTVYGIEASLGYMFSHKSTRPGVVIGVNAAYERLNNHFDVNHAVMNMETHEIIGNCESFVLASNQLMLGPCLKICFDNLKSYLIVGYDFGILPSEYITAFNAIENNREITYNRFHIGMKTRFP